MTGSGDRHPLIAAAASLKVTVWALFILLVLTVWGTLYQADHGLYEAQQQFYYSWFFLAWGWMPLPGGQLVMAVLFINLSASLIDLGARRKLTVGYVLTHGGLMLMLGAGGLIFLFGQESDLQLLEGQASNVSVSEDWEVAVWRADARRQEREVTAFDLTGCREGSRLVMPGNGAAFTVVRSYPNADISMADGQAVLRSKSGASEPFANRPGLELTCETAGGQATRLLLSALQPRPQRVQPAGSEELLMVVRRRTHVLPAVIELIDFQKEVYPGTQTPRVFASVVKLKDGELEREVRISMNKPLRYRGFTFFQSSYQQFSSGQESTVLAVVKNYARHLPYLATLLTGLGMTVHFTGRLILYLRRKHAADRGTAS